MSDPSELVGKRIEQYTIRQHLARGGMADVYLAYEEELRRKVALKVLLPMLAVDEQYVARFQREAQTVARLDHPNIVHIYAIGLTDDRRPYIAMQYIEGGSLRDALVRVSHQGRLIETTQSLSIIGKMAEALQVAHAAGIVHRDIKPSNILLRTDGRPVLVDLGIASVQGGAKITHTGALIGTPHYMSPEQARGNQVDARSDIYSLGIILYELLAGRRPFEAAQTMAILHQHVYEQPPPLENFRSDLSPQTIYLVHRCLRKDRDERFQTAAELRGAINQVIRAEGGPGVVTDVGQWQPYPTEEYRLSESKIMTPQLQAADVNQNGGGRKWLLGLIPLLILACFVVIWLMILDPLGFTGRIETAETPAAVVAGEGGALGEVSATPSSTFEPPSAPGVDPDAGTSPENTPIVEDTAVPTFTAMPTPTTFTEPTETVTTEPTATAEPKPKITLIGRSILGAPIDSVRFGSGPESAVFIGGIHAGAAPSTVSLAERAITFFTENPERIPPTLSLYIIPNANPDSPMLPGEIRGRMNANGVDLNRNWGCDWKEDAEIRGSAIPGSGGEAPFSEPETKALRDFIIQVDPVVVVFWAAKATDGMSSPGACRELPRVSQRPSEIYGRAAGYEVSEYVSRTGQPTPGDATNWIDDQEIPAIAVLLRDYESVDWNSNLAGMLALLDYYK